ncbi:MAG TPA: PTS transporter subunit EIIC [Cellulomonas sp.]
MSDAPLLAQRVLTLLGGPRNVREVESCMTRLRVEVHDPEAVDLDGLRAEPGVIAVVAGDSWQVVLGPGLVDRVARAMQAALAEAAGGGTPLTDALAAEGAAIKQASRERHDSPVMRAVRRISAVFVPLIPALVACGLIAGVNGIVTNLVSSGTLPGLAGIQPFIGVLSAGFLGLLPVFVGMNAAKELGGTPVLGGATAAIIVSAGVANLTVLGGTLAPGQGGVLGALVAGMLAAWVERWARRWCPDVVALIVVPTVTVVVAGLATVLVVMTVAGHVATVIGDGATWLLANGGIAAGFVLGGLFLPVVMTGMHQALTPIHTTLIEQTGYTVLLPVLAMAGAGQIGAAAALWLRFRRSTLAATIRGALPPGLLGIGEPLIYGVTLPLGRPFVTACVGGAAGGAVVGAFDQLGRTVGAVAIGASDLSLFPLLDGSHGYGWAALGYGAGLLTAYLVGFVATWFFGITDAVVERVQQGGPAQHDDPGPRGRDGAAGHDAAVPA